MKSTERHKLKENEFARTVAHTREVLEAQKRTITIGVDGARRGRWRPLAATCGGARHATPARTRCSPRQSRSTTRRSCRLPRPRPAAPRRFLRQERSRPSRRSSRRRCPSSAKRPTVIPTPRQDWSRSIHLAGILAALGQYPEAEQRFQEVVSKGAGSIYARTARLGLADAQVAQGKYDNAIQIYTELSRDTSSQMPVDGVLMQLGRAYVAGRPQGRSRTNLRPDRPGVPAIELPVGSAAGARSRAEVLTFRRSGVS